ncbi:MAG: GNAT family N-acetyltransferase [Candidatus Atribacteria bacterium]|nr:MAG: GNAT family N-acetyltransferase [Candidatus Atribacteria bacterium]
MSISPNSQNSITIRRAHLSDIPDLLKIGRKCFSRIQFRGIYSYVRPWWQAAITSEAADVYVAQYKGLVIAFAVLVKDEELWRKEKKHRKGPFIYHLLSCIVCPVLTFKILCIRATRLMVGNEHQPKSSIEMSYNRTWLEILAVVPQEQGRGIGKLLLRECESLTKTKGCDAIGLMVSKSNERAIRLYKKMGYQKIIESPEGKFYIKVLNSGRPVGKVPNLQN